MNLFFSIIVFIVLLVIAYYVGREIMTVYNKVVPKLEADQTALAKAQASGDVW
jgi:hypothetical protein